MDQTVQNEKLYFWVLGDLHFRALPIWQELHRQRLAPLFSDLTMLWQAEGAPQFLVSPGDIVETGDLESYQLAQTELARLPGNVPFYPGIGNHEYYDASFVYRPGMAERFHQVWGRPTRYSWQINDILGIMLDYPDPTTLPDPEKMIELSAETLAFLDDTLGRHRSQPVLIFLHCPLRNTVLDRDNVKYLDYNSQQSFFSPENSDAVRAILARHNHPCLFFSGHTHSGWLAPDLIKTEQLGSSPVTFINVMSPWYTGRHHGPRFSDDRKVLTYVPDEPDISPSFAIRLNEDEAFIRVRDHKSQQWLKEWRIPLQ